MYSFLIVHSKSLTHEELMKLKEDVLANVTVMAQGQPFTLTLARDDWQENFERAGGWMEWIERAVVGKDFSSGQAYYTGFISASRTLGKASAQIIYGALAIAKPVVVFEDGRLVICTRVVRTTGDVKNGWTLE